MPVEIVSQMRGASPQRQLLLRWTTNPIIDTPVLTRTEASGIE
jgi:hypothetical protein